MTLATQPSKQNGLPLSISTHLALCVAVVLDAARPEVAIQIRAGEGGVGRVALLAAALGPQNEALRTPVAFLACDAWLAHALARHLLTVIAHRPEQGTTTRCQR